MKYTVSRPGHRGGTRQGWRRPSRLHPQSRRQSNFLVLDTRIVVGHGEAVVTPARMMSSALCLAAARVHVRRRSRAVAGRVVRGEGGEGEVEGGRRRWRKMGPPGGSSRRCVDVAPRALLVGEGARDEGEAGSASKGVTTSV